MESTENKKLRVWYIDRVPSKKETIIIVKNLLEAKFVFGILTIRDLNDDRITDNAMELQVFEDGNWDVWESDLGYDFDTYLKNLDE